MIIYGVAILAICTLSGLYLGSLLGEIIGIDVNVGNDIRWTDGDYQWRCGRACGDRPKTGALRCHDRDILYRAWLSALPICALFCHCCVTGLNYSDNC